MSTIRVDNFGPSAGGTTYSASGVARGWINFQGSGTVAINDSLNMSSVVDDAQGRYTVNYSNNFSDALYCMPTGTFESADNESTYANNRMLGVSRASSTASNLKSASFVKMVCSYTGNDLAYDMLEGYITFHGDLA